ncbi:MAG TPA: hypothetical protein PLL10_00185 [Elusimicrobiales bacterium]|nr:hypothetical protein [Elusimicrobiales bacterium]
MEKTLKKAPIIEAGQVIEWPDYENAGRAKRAQELLQRYDKGELTEINGMQDYLDLHHQLDQRRQGQGRAG